MSDTTVSFTVSFKGNPILYNGWNAQSTVRSIKENLETATSVPIANQKLLYKGRILSNDDQTLADLQLRPDAKLILTGTTQSDLQEIREISSRLQRAQQNAQRYTVRPLVRRTPPRIPTRYTFHRLTVLDDYPMQLHALHILETLKNDYGVCAVMEKYKWSVQHLTELSPSERSILGYNRNKGEVIALRLRTDDLKGFRHYPTIRRVLLHELAHMVHSEHNDDFHRLNQELNNYVETLDSGHVLAGSKVHFYNPESRGIKSWGLPTITQTTMDGGYRLGGTVPSSAVKEEQRRRLLAEAAMSRLTQQEQQELDEGCGSCRSNVVDKENDSPAV